MRQIAEYLNTKVNAKKFLKFPETPKLDDVISFLEKNGFVNANVDEKLEYNWKAFNEITSNGNNAFTYKRNKSGDNEYWVRFTKAGVLDENHPVYFLRLTKDGSILSKDVGYIEYTSRAALDVKCTDYDEFRESIINYFNWI